jgi:hypothetical protein
MDIFVVGAIVAILVVAFLGSAVALALRGYWTSRGPRLVRCPEEGGVAKVEINAWWSGLMEVFGGDRVAIRNCSRWPEHGACGRECLQQIETSADGCSEREIVARWHEGKSCPLCGATFDSMQRGRDRFAYISPDGTTSPLRDLDGENLVHLFWSCEPVCWDCHSSPAPATDTLKDGRPPFYTTH